MWAILYSVTIVYASFGTSISTEVIGSYSTASSCQDVAKQLGEQSTFPRARGNDVEKYATARCIQIKDKP